MSTIIDFKTAAFIVFTCAAVCACLGTWAARAFSIKFGVIDEPKDGKLHTKKTPVLGGLGFGIPVLLMFSAALFASYAPASFYSQKWIDPSFLALCEGIVQIRLKLAGVILTSALMLAVGLMDDLYEQKPAVKIALQSVVVIIMCYVFSIRLSLFVQNPHAQSFVTLIWVLFIMNTFNLLDNADGMCGSVAFVISGLFFALFLRLDNVFIAFAALALAGSLIGFLVFNFPPAKIFMGNSGSSFIGFVLALISVLGTYIDDGAKNFTVIAPVIIFGMPLFDTISVFLIRFLNGKPLFVGDTNHFSHRLLKLGVPPRGMVIAASLMTLAYALPALVLPDLDFKHALMLMAQSFALFGIIALLEYYAGRR